MPKLDQTYPQKLKDENKIILLEPYKGSNLHHEMQCMICNHIWVATPKAKVQTLKKNGVTGCPNCDYIRKYKEIRLNNLERLKNRGIIVLTEGYDGRTYLDYKKDPHLKIEVKNINCGHTFKCSPSNLLGPETECGVCGPQKRAEILIKLSKENSRKWQETAPEWQKYRNNVHNLTRKIYQENIKKINPNNHIRGHAGVKDAYQLDHIVPIRFCFDNNIPVEVCADISNLQMLKWENNITFGGSLKGDLPPLFLEYIDKHKPLC